KRWRYDIPARRTVELDSITSSGGGFAGRRGGVARGRQATEAMSPDSSHKACYRDRDLWLADADGGNERQLTTDGSAEKRIKYGTASWVYGEELRQTTAMWWSPNNTQIAFYRFDEMPVRDYYLQTDQTTVAGD